MLRRLFYSVLVMLAMAFTVHAQNIPTPKEHFGFNIGDNYMLATYSQTEAYVKKLAAASDRAKLVDIGKTEEGRSQFMLIITSPENQKKLERYREISLKLAHAEGLNDADARALAAEGKTVVWIDGGLHATETVGAHQLIEIMYQLTSRTDPETIRILNDVIILCTHANPDGQELVSNWYMRNPIPEKRSLSQLPRLYEKYAGHDNNRDFFMMNLRETQNINRQLYIEWMPQVMYNHHQAGPPGSVVAGAPYRDPFNYVFDPVIVTSLDALGAAISNRLNAEGKPGYTERAGSSYSTWYNGGLRTTTYFHNMVGLLTEIIGNPTPSEVPLVPQRLLPSGATPFPVLPQKWYFRQSIDYSVSMNYAVLDYASRNRDQLLYNIYRMGKNSIERGEKDNWTLSPKRIAEITQLYQADLQKNNIGRPAAPDAEPSFGNRGAAVPMKYYDTVLKNPLLRDARGYIIPSDQPDFPAAVRFLNALIRTGVLVHKATDAFTVNGKTYPAGSYVVKTNQAFRPHVLDLFEPQDHPNDFQYPGGPPIPPYDAAGWTLAYSMGVQFDRVLDALEGPFQRIPYGELQTVTSNAPAAAAGYVMSAQSNNAFITANDLLKEGVEVFRSTDGSLDAPAGSFYVPASAKAKAIVDKAAKENGLKLTAAAKKPSAASLKRIQPARIALWDNYGGSMPSGWVRFIMEQYHFPIDVIYPKDIDTGGLRAKYDVLIFVDGAIPAPAVGGASQRSSGFGFAAPKPEDIPEEFRNRLGRITADKSIPQLKKFMEEGGSIVTIGSSTNLAYHAGVPVHNALMEMVNGQEQRLPNEKYYIPGSILRVSVDSTEQAAWGMGSQADVYFDNSPVFNITPEAIAKGTVKPIAWFANNKPLRSGWAWGQAYLKDGVAAFTAAVGQGKLYAFGPEITFRAQTHGSFKLLFNELYTMQNAGKQK